MTKVSRGPAVSSPGQDSESTLASIKSQWSWQRINSKQRTFKCGQTSILFLFVKTPSSDTINIFQTSPADTAPPSPSLGLSLWGRVWWRVHSPGSGSMPEIRSEAYCLAGKTRIIFLTFSYLHATMREDRMSKLFRKISPYTEKHLHLLLVSSSTSTQWAGPFLPLCAHMCVHVLLIIFSTERCVSVCFKGAVARGRMR